MLTSPDTEIPREEGAGNARGMETPTDDRLEIVIIGCGIIGSVLALGLIQKNIRVKVYEQAGTLREIGAGIAFTANARECMSLIDPRIVDCVNAVATANGDPENPNNNMQFIDGYTHTPGEDDMKGKILYKLAAGPREFEGCHRAHFLEEVMKLMADGVVQLSKRLESIEEPCGDKLVLTFSDGTCAIADAGHPLVIGCDGIKSRVREIILGKDNPASYPHYTHKIAFRGLVPMDEAIARLGDYRARNQHMYGGPGAHVLHFPVAKQKLMNVVAFVDDPNEWPLDRAMSQPATKGEVAAAFEGWGPTVRSIIDLLPPELEKWAVFDSFDHPAPTYSRGRVCIAGDAAHASSPHHGAGAGIGIEDALALSVLLEGVQKSCRTSAGNRWRSLEKAFSLFTDVRHERSQWLVRSSREACEIYEWNDSKCGADMTKGHEEITRRSHKIWYFDIQDMIRKLEEGYSREMGLG
ncbi:hypothetical protein ATEG_08666 [Aspergillus terreus NIH2624]|uniref:FAD-binding domain-containing protein n=1 Tax=Aspergillus terreus (strain NIH 2624 / FGSC A1156) TaxID=341663 RepID=Q0CCB8_ASPTN|nr:uncharacterized protein ATEG_08666 [Aspergillus terreus NIH2624]EAU30798.1 hypothetical protein ATEG_08666 [Aspergillus terreus NIH2624]